MFCCVPFESHSAHSERRSRLAEDFTHEYFFLRTSLNHLAETAAPRPMRNVPDSTTVSPEYEFAPSISRVPSPDFVTPPAPEMPPPDATCTSPAAGEKTAAAPADRATTPAFTTPRSPTSPETDMAAPSATAAIPSAEVPAQANPSADCHFDAEYVGVNDGVERTSRSYHATPSSDPCRRHATGTRLSLPLQ